MIKHWLQAFRLRTLPLALSSISMGGFLAASHAHFQLSIFLLCVLTTILLQILSNLANDYGDSQSGIDSVLRQGPSRTVQAGLISSKAMLNALFLFGVLSLSSGLFLLWYSVSSLQDFIIFFGLGLLSIAAAVAYTVGKKPYGYIGMGDISVLIFFGGVAVLGTYYLQAHSWHWDLLLPACSSGLLAVAVLNVNNIRDIDSDRSAGKFSIPVRLGREKAVLYHAFLLVGALMMALLYALLHFHSWYQVLFLFVLPQLYQNFYAVQTLKNPKSLDPYLKQMALTSLQFTTLFGIGQLL